jgi:hypothetical protein
MSSLITTFKVFVAAFIGVLAVALIAHFTVPGSRFQPWVAASMASGCVLAVGVKARWQLSRGTGAALAGALSGLGYIVGVWLSVHA